jgi:hypothetical protein
MNLDATTVLKAVLGTSRPEATRLLIDASGAVADLVVDGRRYQLTLRAAEEVPRGKEPAPVPEASSPSPSDPRPAPSAATTDRISPYLSAVEEPEDRELVPPDALKPRGLPLEEHFRRLLRALAGQPKLPDAMRERCTFLADHALYDDGDSKRLLDAANRFHKRGDCAPLLTVLLDMREKVPRPKLVRS